MALLAAALSGTAAAALVGQWDFDDPADLTRATLGKNLALVGTATAVSGHGTGDGAAALGVGSHFRCTPDLAPNGGSATRANEYTLVFDLRLPAASDRQWRALFQSNPANADDAVKTDLADVDALVDYVYADHRREQANVACIRYFQETYGIWRRGTRAPAVTTPCSRVAP